MGLLLNIARISRQGFHKGLRVSPYVLSQTKPQDVLDLASDVQAKYLPGAGARELYRFIRSDTKLSKKLINWGRRSFEELCLDNGFRVHQPRFRPRTTIRGQYIFPNLIEGMEINNINQVMVSDISYIFSAKGKLIGYATSLIDLYSRFLLGLQFSQGMTAKETVLPVFKNAIRIRTNTKLNGAIFHSDGGKQYIYHKFLNLINMAKMKSSMARNCYENPHAEAFNDTLKNHILPFFDVNSFSQLKKLENFIVHSYNHNKSHSGIQGKTPFQFENYISNLKTCQRTILKIKVLDN